MNSITKPEKYWIEYHFCKLLIAIFEISLSDALNDDDAFFPKTLFLRFSDVKNISENESRVIVVH